MQNFLTFTLLVFAEIPCMVAGLLTMFAYIDRFTGASTCLLDLLVTIAAWSVCAGVFFLLNWLRIILMEEKEWSVQLLLGLCECIVVLLVFSNGSLSLVSKASARIWRGSRRRDQAG